MFINVYKKGSQHWYKVYSNRQSAGSAAVAIRKKTDSTPVSVAVPVTKESLTQFAARMKVKNGRGAFRSSLGNVSFSMPVKKRGRKKAGKFVLR